MSHMDDQTIKDTILATVGDLVSDFLYYDRKEDEALERDAIQDAIKDGSITVEEIVNKFAQSLREGIG